MNRQIPSEPVVRFGPFEADLAAGELRKDGAKLKLVGQPLEILALLLERRGEVVTREELRAGLWPSDTFVDFDHGLNAAVNRLRSALGDSADNPRYVETLLGRGYRFIARVDRCSAPSVITVATGEQTKSFFLRSRAGIFALFFISTGALAGVLWRRPARPAIIERKLTANSPESSVSSAAVSPDGKYLAYSDRTGIYIKLIRTGETHALPLPSNFSGRVDDWFPNGAALLISHEEQPGKASLWTISAFGGSLRRLADDASGGSVSPDGNHIAFLRVDVTYDGLLGREEWVMNSDGTDQEKVAADRVDGSQVGVPAWSPDGTRIVYIRSNWAYDARASSVEVNDWQNARPKTVFSDNRLAPAVHWLPDGRLVYALGNVRTSSREDSILWTASLERSGRISGSPKQIGQGHGRVSQISGSSDGKTVIFRSENWSPTVQIGTLSADGTYLRDKRRLTLDESVSVATAWLPDSKTVLFNSDRNGTPEIFKQASDQPLGESLISGAEQLSQPQLTPDGSEILYISTPKPPSPEKLSSIFAISVRGRTPRLILKDAHIWNVKCARLPSTLCLYSVTKGNKAETLRFDVWNGKTSDPPQIDPDCNWSLSPDGLQRAIVPYGFDQATIQLRSTSSGQTRNLVVQGWNGLMGATWSADGKSLFAAWHNHELESALLNVALDGRVSVLLRSSNEVWGAVPSPDGRFLAITEAAGTKNVWEIENF